MKRSVLFFLLVLLLADKQPPAQAIISLPPSAAGLSVSVDAASGAYKVTKAIPAWTFAGTVGAPMTDVIVTQGRDNLGIYGEITFHWNAGRPLRGAIRRYQARPVVQFAITTPQASQNPTPDFPDFTQFPQNLHPLSFEENVFSPHVFRLAHNGTPWFLFDDAAHTAVLSPASDFLVSQMHGDGKLSLASGLNPQLSGLPAGFTHKSLLTIGTGIGTTIHAWGDALTDASGKARPSDNADLLIKYLGYWTDNGAVYYYNYDKDKGYAGTLLALRDHYRQEQIPIRYLQLDSWWYQKTRTSPAGHEEGAKNPKLPEGTWNAYGGTLDYSASPALFPQGLAAFQKQIGLPLAVHARWIDPTSPYHQNYKISGIAAIDPRWWDERAAYLNDGGVVTYEQDWLNEIYAHSPAMASTLEAGPAFADNMARATKQRGQTMQYCMALPRFFLQGSQYANLTTIRTSGDRMERGKWNDFLYTSLLADAMRIRPWTDVFLSTEMGNLTLATLSSGPVGIGDAIGSESRDNIRRAVRGDGVIVKPDAPLLPTDASIMADARGQRTPLVSATYTDNGSRTAYVFACTRPGDTSGIEFTPASLGLRGRVYVYRVAEKIGKTQDAASPYTDTLTIPDWSSYVLAPVGRSGVAFLGDAGQIVGTGRQRLPSIQDAPGRMTATVVFASGEKSVTLHGWTASAPSVTVIGGMAQPVAYDAATGHFTVTVSPAANARNENMNGDPVTQATVVLRTGA